MHNKEIKISVIIPVFNSDQNIQKLINNLVSVLNKDFDSHEIILVDDNSLDNSWQTIKKICNDNQNIKGLRLRKNVGQHNAIFAGLNYASGKYIVTMDDDGQNLPVSIKSLFDEITNGYDVVYANYKFKKHNFFRKFGSFINNIVASFLFQKPLDIKLTSFRIFNNDIKKEILKCKSTSIYLDGLIFHSTKNVKSVFVEHKKREFGKSTYTFFKLVGLWLQMATGFSILPLRIASFFGMIFSITSFVVTFWLIFLRELPPNIPPGWTSLIVVAFFFGGVQLLALGLIGEYVGKTYLSMNNISQYSEKEKINII